MIAAADGLPITLLQTGALAGYCPLEDDDAPTQVQAAQQQAGQQQQQGQPGYMIVKGIHDWAIPMDEVLRVATLPPQLEWADCQAEDGGSWPLAQIVHEGNTIALWNIDGRKLDGQAHTSHSVVILRTGESQSAVLFDTPQKIVPASVCRRLSIQGRGGKRLHLVVMRLPGEESDRTYALWDHQYLPRLKASALAC